tara:strand:- start:49 stop:468 length:420 start_codon:yes stop_codon:yes gene_type:complete
MMRDVFKLFEGWRRFNYGGRSDVSDPFYGPPPIINDVIDCWAQEGIRFYSHPHLQNGISYHVMLPTDELEFHLEIQRSTHDYSYLTQEIVSTGRPPRAVRVRVGKNGRAIIDQDADIVQAAKQVGLIELPVLFSFEDEV